MEPTCGGSRAFDGRAYGRVSTGLGRTVTGRRGLLTRPSLLSLLPSMIHTPQAECPTISQRGRGLVLRVQPLKRYSGLASLDIHSFSALSQ